MNWYVVCTKPNSEIKVANALKAIGINAYCPVLKYIKQYSDRKKKVEKPVLTSYVLVNISEKDRVKVFSIPGVLRYLFWLGKPAQVRNEEIEILQNELNGYSNIPCRSNLNIGSNFTLPFGPFKGLKGEILNISNNKLKLELKSIGMLLTFNIA